MTKATDSLTTSTGSASRRVRWRSAAQVENPKLTPVWWRVLRALVFACSIVGLGTYGYFWYAVPPRNEPAFEEFIEEPPGPVKDFALKDVGGAVHTQADWTGRPGIVLFFIAAAGSISDDYAGEMARLAREYEPRGILFYGIHSNPGVAVEAAAASAARHGFSFPVLLDPIQSVARQAGATVTPEAVLLADDGQVLYHGRIDDRVSRDGQHQSRATVHDLENALKAVLADELPVITHRKAVGSPLPWLPAESVGRELVTFTKDVAPILWNNCARCHRPGAVAPFSLITYKDAAKRADFINEVISTGRMPPWKPHAGAGVFRDAPRLSAAEKDLLARWADTGRKEGDPADLPSVPQFSDGWQLGKPDVILTMPEPFRVPASGRDVYWAFALPMNIGRDLVINGVEFRPGNRRVVHHSRVYLDSTGDARRCDGAEQGPGFPGWVGSPGSMELPYPGLGGWTPGMTARLAPDGVGRRISDGSDVVLRIHYHPSGKEEEDRSCVGLYAMKQSVTKTMAGLTFCTDKIDIPPGAKRHPIIISAWVKADVHLYTVVPHAHYLAREFRLSATLPDGTPQPLLWITDWDLDWQDQYRYLRPVRLPKGTLLTMAVYFDNSADNPRNPHKPPRRTHFGISSDDEMCACHLEFLPDDPTGYKAYPQRSPFGL